MCPETFRLALLAVTISNALSFPDTATSQNLIEEPTRLVERDLSGPRFGFTYRPNTPAGYSSEIGPVVSQFGWHFEHHVGPLVDGPQFVTQFVPLVAGVEHGKFMPSLSLGLGIRMPNGYEFGLGPSVGVGYDDQGQPAGRSALFVTAGRSFDYAGVRIPVNLVFAANRDGSRVSVLTGYAIRRATRRVGS